MDVRVAPASGGCEIASSNIKWKLLRTRRRQVLPIIGLKLPELFGTPDAIYLTALATSLRCSSG